MSMTKITNGDTIYELDCDVVSPVLTLLHIAEEIRYSQPLYKPNYATKHVMELKEKIHEVLEQALKVNRLQNTMINHHIDHTVHVVEEQIKLGTWKP
jgi:hypothetical protein